MSVRELRAMARDALCQAVDGVDPPLSSLIVVPQAMGVSNSVLWVDVDSHEVARRRSAGLGAFNDYGVLRLLCNLPTGNYVQTDDLTARERRVVARLPRGAADVCADSVVRRAAPPLRVRAAVVYRRNWKNAVRAASRFAPLCPRVAVADGPIDLIAPAQAAFYGVGLCTRDEDTSASVTLVSSAAPKEPAALDPTVWLLWEEIYASVNSTLNEFTTAG